MTLEPLSPTISALHIIQNNYMSGPDDHIEDDLTDEELTEAILDATFPTPTVKELKRLAAEAPPLPKGFTERATQAVLERLRETGALADDSEEIEGEK